MSLTILLNVTIPIVMGLFHLAPCPQGSFILNHVSDCFFFLGLDNIQLYECATCCLYIHLSVGTWVISTFRPMCTSCYEYRCADTYLGSLLPILLYIYSELAFLDPVGRLCLHFPKTIPFFTMAAPAMCVHISSHHHPYLSFPVDFFDMATRMSVNIALICISLMISETEIFLCAHPLFKVYEFTF